MISSLKKPASLRESILIFVAMLAACYFLYTYFYAPKKQQALKLQEEIIKLDKQIEGTEKLLAALKHKQDEQRQEQDKQMAQVQSQDPRIQLIKQFKTPTYKNIFELLNAITQPEFRSGLEINSLKYGEAAKKGGYAAITFNLTASGQFAKIVEFLERMEEMPALLSLDAIHLTVNQKDKDLVSLELTCTYYRLEGNHG